MIHLDSLGFQNMRDIKGSHLQLLISAQASEVQWRFRLPM